MASGNNADQELFTIVAQVQGQADIERLTAAIQKQEDKIRLLTAELRLGAISEQQFGVAAKNAAFSIAQMRSQLQSFQQAAAAGNANTGKLGQAMIQAGYAADDLQYGFKGIANNIQPLLGSIPRLAAIAPYVSIAAIAAYQLYEHWDQLNDLLGTGATKSEADRMEELRDKTAKTAEETARLLKYEQQRHSLSIQNQPKRQVTETQDAVSEGLREVGGKRVDEAVNQIFGDRLRNQVSDEKTQAARRAKQGLGDAQGRVDDLARQEPGTVGKHEFGQAIKDRDRAQDKFNKALEAFNKEYNENRDKLKAGLATDLNARGEPEKLEKFVAEAVKRGLLTEKEGKTLRESTPEAKSEKAEDEFARKREEESASRLAQFQEQGRQAEIGRSSAGLEQRFAPDILGNVARGRSSDPVALAVQVSKALQQGGKAKEEADQLAPDIAASLIDRIGQRVRERSSQQGLSKEEAAAREAEDDAAAARSKAPKPKGAINDLAGFADSLQKSLFNKSDPIQAAILAENRKTADRLEKLVEETRKARPRNAPVAVAAGP